MKIRLVYLALVLANSIALASEKRVCSAPESMNLPPKTPITRKSCLRFTILAEGNGERGTVHWGKDVLYTASSSEKARAPEMDLCDKNAEFVGLVQPGSQWATLVFSFDSRGWSSQIPQKVPPCKKEPSKIFSDLQVTFDRKIIGTLNVSREKAKPDIKGLNLRLPIVKNGPVLASKNLYVPGVSMTVRPYIWTTASKFSDPRNWSLAGSLPASLQKRIEAEYKERVIVPLKNGEDWVDFPSSLLKVTKAYADRDKNLVVGVVFDWERAQKENPNFIVEEIPESWEYQDSHWYWLKGNSIKYIGTRLVPVDAGDYNADGKSEFMFFQDCSYCAGSGGSAAGVILFDEDFKEIAVGGFRDMNRL